MLDFWHRLRMWLFPPDKVAIRFEAYAKTDKGRVRADNQDNFLSRPDDSFFCVADGMGGAAEGATASAWTCEAMSAACSATRNASGTAREEQVNAQLATVNEKIRLYSRERHYKSMGTTIAGFMSDPADGGCRARIFHVGDSRVYRYRYGRLDALTRDHTVGNELGRALSCSSEEQSRALQARTNPLTHILTHAVGTELRVRPEWRTVDVQPDDRFLICSDGVHDMLDDKRIAELMKGTDSPHAVVARIEAAVRKAGAFDNYTIICFIAKAVPVA